VVLFGGDVISQNELELSLSEYLRTHPSEAPVLLVKMDARASLSQLVDISRAAKASGFASLQLAAERLGPEGDDFGQ
jgi:biopolymer transport protein ExbD